MAKPKAVVAGGPSVPPPNGLRSVPEWEGLQRGDKVRVRGRKGTFTFIEYTTTDAGEEWVTFYGIQFESALPENVRKA